MRAFWLGLQLVIVFFFFLSVIHAKCSLLVSHCDKGTEPKCMFLVHLGKESNL